MLAYNYKTICPNPKCSKEVEIPVSANVKKASKNISKSDYHNCRLNKLFEHLDRIGNHSVDRELVGLKAIGDIDMNLTTGVTGYELKRSIIAFMLKNDCGPSDSPHKILVN